MIELLLLVVLGRTLIERAQRTGVPVWWAAFGPVLWIVGKVGGLLLGSFIELERVKAYPLGLLYGAIGAFVGWMLVEYHPAARPPEPLLHARHRRR